MFDQQDWISVARHWPWGNPRLPLSRAGATVLRDGIQRGLLMPRQWQRRRQWIHSSAAWDWVAKTNHRWQTTLSLGLLFDGYQQIAGRGLVITDRLHGHLLACLAGVTNVRLANAYHKNLTAMETWGNYLPMARYADFDNIVDVVMTLSNPEPNNPNQTDPNINDPFWP